jgi:hypothetical protein
VSQSGHASWQTNGAPRAPDNCRAGPAAGHAGAGRPLDVFLGATLSRRPTTSSRTDTNGADGRLMAEQRRRPIDLRDWIRCCCCCCRRAWPLGRRLMLEPSGFACEQKWPITSAMEDEDGEAGESRPLGRPIANGVESTQRRRRLVVLCNFMSSSRFGREGRPAAGRPSLQCSISAPPRAHRLGHKYRGHQFHGSRRRDRAFNSH